MSAVAGSSSGRDAYPGEARQTVERAIWQRGITGESCALLGERILSALVAEGLVISLGADPDGEDTNSR